MDLGIFSAFTLPSKLQQQPQQPQRLSDDESLEDHCSSVEDFQGVTLQLDYSHNHTPVSPSPDQLISEDNPKWEKERRELLSLRGDEYEEKDTINSSELPQISITPMTPPSPSIALESPDQSTVSLNSTNPSPMHRPLSLQNQYTPTKCWGAQSPPATTGNNESDAKEFFACRDSIIQNAIDEVQSLVDPEQDGGVRGTWLLTEIDHWDNEKERLVLLCTKTIVIVKYDFIAMKEEEHRRVHLCVIDKIIQGELKYPDRSLAPRLNGIAGGILGVVKGCLVPTVSGTVKTVGNAVLYRTLRSKPSAVELAQEATAANVENTAEAEVSGNDEDMTSKTSIMSALSMDKFEPRARNVQGIRIMWNQDLPLSFTQKWNPFDKSIPWITFTSHPLLWHKGGGGGIHRSFDVDSFSREFIDVLTQGSGGDTSPSCRIEYKPIVMETYVGLTSLLHNANDLGFYKVRGRVSF